MQRAPIRKTPSFVVRRASAAVPSVQPQTRCKSASCAPARRRRLVRAVTGRFRHGSKSRSCAPPAERSLRRTRTATQKSAPEGRNRLEQGRLQLRTRQPSKRLHHLPARAPSKRLHHLPARAPSKRLRHLPARATPCNLPRCGAALQCA